MCVCDKERERKREGESVSKREREKEREREREREYLSIGDVRLSLMIKNSSEYRCLFHGKKAYSG